MIPIELNILSASPSLCYHLNSIKRGILCCGGHTTNYVLNAKNILLQKMGFKRLYVKNGQHIYLSMFPAQFSGRFLRAW